MREQNIDARIATPDKADIFNQYSSLIMLDSAKRNQNNRTAQAPKRSISGMSKIKAARSKLETGQGFKNHKSMPRNISNL